MTLIRAGAARPPSRRPMSAVPVSPDAGPVRLHDDST